MRLLSKIFIIFAAIMLVGLTLWVYFLNQEKTSQNNTLATSSSSLSNEHPDFHSYAISESKIKSTQSKNNQAKPLKLPEKSAWKLNANIQPGMQLPQGISIYEPVEFDQQGLYPQPGEELALPLPQAEVVNVKIESSESHANGDYTWRGHLIGYGNDYPVVTTYGKHSSFSTITTPQGSYTLEVVNGQGWIYKNPSVFELSAPGHEDGLEIPR